MIDINYISVLLILTKRYKKLSRKKKMHIVLYIYIDLNSWKYNACKVTKRSNVYRILKIRSYNLMAHVK